MGFSDSEHQKLMEIFKAFDINGDGQLEYHEIYEGYKQYFNGDLYKAEKEAKNIFEKLDFNNNGTIDYSEFLITHLDPSKVINEERLREVFDMFDSDQSGYITVDEIKKMLGGSAGNKDAKTVPKPR
jgi:Ca2+-binding EF-hand superfamily protein